MYASPSAECLSAWDSLKERGIAKGLVGWLVGYLLLVSQWLGPISDCLGKTRREEETKKRRICWEKQTYVRRKTNGKQGRNEPQSISQSVYWDVFPPPFHSSPCSSVSWPFGTNPDKKAPYPPTWLTLGLFFYSSAKMLTNHKRFS